MSKVVWRRPQHTCNSPLLYTSQRTMDSSRGTSRANRHICPSKMPRLTPSSTRLCLRSTRFRVVPNGIWIGSAVFAQHSSPICARPTHSETDRQTDRAACNTVLCACVKERQTYRQTDPSACNTVLYVCVCI